MYKAIALLKARADLSKADFIHDYETRHAPLILTCTAHLLAHRRNYLDPADAFIFSINAHGPKVVFTILDS